MRDRSLCAFTAGGEMHTISSVGKFVVPEIRFCVPAALSNTHTAAALRDPTATLMALTRRTQRSAAARPGTPPHRCQKRNQLTARLEHL